MSRFYAKADDKYRCRKAVLRHDVVTITGLSSDGTANVFTGRVQAVEGGHRIVPGYPLQVTIDDCEPPKPA